MGIVMNKQKQDDNNNKEKKINCTSNEEWLDYLGKIESFLSTNNLDLLNNLLK